MKNVLVTLDESSKDYIKNYSKFILTFNQLKGGNL